MKSFRSFQLDVWSARAVRLVLALFLSMIAACGGGYGGGGGGGGTGMSASAPRITTQPASMTVTAPAPATFTVDATTPSGYALSYQWMMNGTNISGATAASYTTGPTATMNSGEMFSVRVTNAYGSVTSNNAMLTVM
jgi:hypothetical protein